MSDATIRRFEGLDALDPAHFTRPAVTVGMFDGLHRGHRHLVEELCALADRMQGDSVVVTFDTHPMAVIEGASPRQILSTEHRVHLLERFGVDAVVLLPFDAAMRATTYQQFVERILVARMGVTAVLFGYNSNFGHHGEGTPETVRPLGAKHGFEVVEAPVISVHGEPISSSRIRDAIQTGDLATAADMLGRAVALYGVVVRGDGRGRQLGFPTANIDLEGELAPPPGVYQVIAEVRDQRYAGVANIGYRPTFKTDQAEPILEVHVPAIDYEFYGERIEVEIVRKMRDERKFPSKDALVQQIRADVASLGLSDD